MSATSITSEVTILQSLSIPSYEISWVGSTPVGTLAVQVSNSYSVDGSGNVLNAGSWTTVTLTVAGLPVTSVPISGNTGNDAINLDHLGFYAVRCVYTKGSGTGTMQAIICGKV